MPQFSTSLLTAIFLLLPAILTVNGTAVADDEEPAPRPVLILNGQPLSRLGHSTFTFQVDSGAAASQEQHRGQICGLAVDVASRPLAFHPLVLRSRGDRTTLATAITDAYGRFAFAGLPPGWYVVEAISDNRLIATSGTVRLSDDGMTFVQLNPPWGRSSVEEARKGRGALFWTVVGAGIGGGIGMLAYLDSDCKYADTLCPLVPMTGAMMGAAFGFLLGVGRSTAHAATALPARLNERR